MLGKALVFNDIEGRRFLNVQVQDWRHKNVEK